MGWVRGKDSVLNKAWFGSSGYEGLTISVFTRPESRLLFLPIYLRNTYWKLSTSIVWSSTYRPYTCRSLPHIQTHDGLNPTRFCPTWNLP